jgi:uncharacterized protein
MGGRLEGVAEHRSFSADGFAAGWVSVDDGRAEHLSLNWDNEAWTANVHVERERIDYVIRVSPLWQVRQFLLFRDMEQPDLWLGTDGHGRWGELNGAHRPELDGARDVTIGGSPFVHSIPIRRLPLAVGDEAELIVLAIDAETLGVVRRSRKYVRLAERRWRVDDRTSTIEFDVDDYGVPTDIGDELRRVA